MFSIQKHTHKVAFMIANDDTLYFIFYFLISMRGCSDVKTESSQVRNPVEQVVNQHMRNGDAD